MENTLNLTNNEWAARIAAATPAQLIEINYELLLVHIENAIVFIDNQQETEFKHAQQKALAFLKELITALDFTYEISNTLLKLYLHLNKLIITSGIQKKSKKLLEAKKMTENLLLAWKQIMPSEQNESVFENADQLYAGLTYGKGTLNESVIEKSNGYKA